MLYKELAEYYEKLESTSKKLEKADILSELYKKTQDRLLRKIVLLSMGLVYPQTGEELGIANETVKRVIEKAYGIDKKSLSKKFRETGDLGSAAGFFAKNRKQSTLMKKDLTVETVFENLRKLPDISGMGSQEKKISLIAELLSMASEKEAKYLVRTALGELRIGVASGTVRDAIAKAFNQDSKEVEHVFNIIVDYGCVAEMAKKGSLEAEIELGHPVRMMLADRAPNLEEALKTFEKPAIEMKLDGFRAQIHKNGDKIRIFSRRMEEVARQFPEIVEWARKAINAGNAIVEGEIMAVDSMGNPRPFQELSRRIQRKYNIEKMVKEIPVRIDIFDTIFVEGINLMRQPLEKRWNKLRKIMSPINGKFDLVEHIETQDLKKADKFYQHCLAMGEEGVIVKNMEAHYQPGKRVGYWLKVKPTMDPLDLVIIGASWGEGKRGKYLGSLVLAARDDKTGEFVPTGMLGSGLTDEQLEEVTYKLKKDITQEKGREVSVKPRIVIEVAYEEIQKSPKYPSGYALRFPRLIRFREEEKAPKDADTLKTIEKLFMQQKKRK